ncbi:hypothetical protein [Clostridium sp. YIM B02500]|uniref:hypothetical protein n=1 Tax=Clostridium sp. YIM B02500 TaxID=2910681 RepID=UPI001EEE9160|nr:hypothetical protein [Clostridium sp. YIM B02500]
MKYGFMKSGFLYKKCKVCHQEFNVSVKNKAKDKDYVCFECEEKAKKKAKKYGNTPKVLLKNKSKFNV